jgi:hypothetical protein
MSYTSYSDARMSHVVHSTPRKALKSPERPIALRKELIASSKTSLVLKPQGDTHSAVSYKITEEDGTPAFTVTGRKYSDRSCREFRDASGLPLFELHGFNAVTFSFQWYITLPGTDDVKVATGSPRMSWGGEVLKFTFQNMAAVDAKREEEKELTLRVKRHGEALTFFDILDEDRRVAEVRESIRHNLKLNLTRGSRGSKYRPALDLVIMPGVDASLVSCLMVLVLIVAD